VARALPDPLFATESDLARQHGLSLPEWTARATVLEREGFPRRDPLTGLRYARAVQAFWDRRYGLSAVEAMVPDGQENLNAL
jgi:hypothetical protein